MRLELQLVPTLTAMAHGKQDHFLPIGTIKHNIAALSEGNQPLAIVPIHIAGRMPNAGLRLQDTDTGADGLNRSDCSVRVFIGEKLMQPFYVGKRLSGPLQR